MKNQTTRAGADPATPPADENEDVFVAPIGTEALLDAQLAQALAIMRDMAAFVRFPNLDMTDRMRLAETAGSLMSSSATLGAVATRLKQGPKATRHHIIVSRSGPGGGKGSGEVENE